MKLIKITHPVLGYVLINEADFDPEQHELFVEVSADLAPPALESKSPSNGETKSAKPAKPVKTSPEA